MRSFIAENKYWQLEIGAIMGSNIAYGKHILWLNDAVRVNSRFILI